MVTTYTHTETETHIITFQVSCNLISYDSFKHCVFVCVDMYVKDIQTGITNGDAEPITERETPATAMVDGKNVLGPVVGKYCMNLAIKVINFS